MALPVTRLRQENARLRAAIAELEQLLEEASRQQADPATADRIKEFESLLVRQSFRKPLVASIVDSEADDRHRTALRA